MTRQPGTIADALTFLAFVVTPLVIVVTATLFGALVDGARHTVETFTNERGDTP
jgi:hypothetical protein